METAKERVNYETYANAYSSAQSDYQRASETLTAAQSTLSKAESTVNTAYENYEESQTSDELESLREELNKCTLRAESSGTVTALDATVGNKPNGTIATIQNTSKLKVSISIEEYDVQNVAVGMKAIITSDATEEEMEGTVTQISPVASTQGMGSSSSTFSAEVEILNPDENLLIGMNAMVEIILS